LGGRLRARAFRRIGALADGWLGSFLTPDEARAGREAIERAAAQAGRHIEPDHFGISLALVEGPTASCLPSWLQGSAGVARTSIPANWSPPAGTSCTGNSTATWKPD